jgi:hypothetical protein
VTPSRVNGSRTSGISVTRDGVKQLDWASRNPNDGEMTASGLIT